MMVLSLWAFFNVHPVLFLPLPDLGFAALSKRILDSERAGLYDVSLFQVASGASSLPQGIAP
jgi:hypothetical protein